MTRGYKSLGALVHVRFDKVISLAHRDRDEVIARFSMGTVPIVGELVNINGEPFQVIERGWAVDAEDGAFAYLRVFGYQEAPIP